MGSGLQICGTLDLYPHNTDHGHQPRISEPVVDKLRLISSILSLNFLPNLCVASFKRLLTIAIQWRFLDKFSQTSMESSLLPISTGDFRSLSSFNSRSSPRSRRDNSVLPTFDPPQPKQQRPSLFVRTSANFKSRKETGRGLWIARLWQASPKFLPWIVLILVWFYIGFHLHIQWSGESSGIQDIGRNESEKVSLEVVSNQIRSDEVLQMGNGGSLAEKEEEMARIGKDDGVLENGEQENRLLEKVDQHEGILEDVELDNSILETEDHEGGESGTNSASNKESHLGRDVGPFDGMERQIMGTMRRSESGCSKQGRFADTVREKSFVMVFHELSMTGAPLAMLELASKIVSCGGKAAAVVLNKRGGLYEELAERGISVVRDKLASSWRAAARAHLVVASSAACNSWIEKYLRHNKKGGERLIWWIMENRREYFDKSKLMLGQAHALVFLSETQVQLWRQWAKEDALVLPSMIKVVSLSVSDDLATSAGLNDESGTVDNFLEARKKRETLRDLVRKEMGLLSSDYLVISLSSINPGKGQLLMLQAALMVAQDRVEDEDRSNLTDSGGASSNETGVEVQVRERGESALNLKVLLGSVGSKSNKPEYLEKINELVDTYPSVADMLLWTQATVHVAPLYAAADAYVMNAQGIGETFGRVTVEAMAFGLPVLGTDAGGTKEIVQGNISGLLHPAGQAGIPVLARNLQWLLRHPELGVEMGKKGRARVQAMYREAPMYEAMTSVFLEAVQEHGG